VWPQSLTKNRKIMQIHFAKEYPWGKPTYFIEKIWAGFALNDFLFNNRDGCWATEHYKKQWPYGDDLDGTSSWWRPFMKSKPKIQTIREDLKDRWQPEKIIHFEQWTGVPYKSKNYHFAPVIPCVSTQKIDIRRTKLGSIGVFIDDDIFWWQMYPNGQIQERNLGGMLQLAQNDGFDSIEDFFCWFDKDFHGKIIHWTDLRY
jgi:hypothetical protein